VNLGEIFVTGWTGDGEHALVEDLDNMAGGGVDDWLNRTRRLAVDDLAHGMIHTGMCSHPG
jgi:hypothetical protein